REAHLLEDKQIPSVRVFDEVSNYTLFQALGWKFEKIQVTWTHFRKKRTRLQHYMKVDIKRAYNTWRRRHKSFVTASGGLRDDVKIIGDGVQIIGDGVTVADSEETLRNLGLTASQITRLRDTIEIPIKRFS
ncbi:hypothetical protein Tco_1010736, partial [Tanacetum coccineum]